MDIRVATLADMDVLAALCPHLRENSEFTARTRRALEAGTVLLAVDGSPVGVVILDHGFFDRGFVHYLSVNPEYRRKGHGSALMRAARQICRTPALFTSTNRSNTPMQALLGRLGYDRCGEVARLDPGDPEVFYVLEQP